MLPDAIRKKYDQAWQVLFDLVLQRNRLLEQLHRMAQLASELTPASGMVIEFDMETAGKLLQEASELAPKIDAAIEDVNHWGKQIGKPKIEKKDNAFKE